MTFFSDIWIEITTGISAFLISIATLIAPGVATTVSTPNDVAEATGSAQIETSQVTGDEEIKQVETQTSPVEKKVGQEVVSKPVVAEEKLVVSPEPETPAVVVEEKPAIVVKSTTSFSSHEREIKNGSSYPAQGIYKLSLDITAGAEDILIPLTTTDSTKGETGVSYSVSGDQTFSGERKSEVKCFSGVAYGNSCVVKAGTTESVTATIWLLPIADGTFGISFTNLGYKVTRDGELNKYPINKATEEIYIQF